MDIYNENKRGNEQKLQESKLPISTRRKKSHHEYGLTLKEDCQRNFSSGDIQNLTGQKFFSN